MTDSIADIFLNAAAELADSERRLRKPPRELFVVECETELGWVPMPGDAYIERADAERCVERSKLTTRMVVYVPAGES